MSFVSSVAKPLTLINQKEGAVKANVSAAGSITSPLASAHLDAIRSLAAYAVLFAHARVLLIASADQAIVELDLVDRLFYVASGYGRTAVMVFFVLSGLLVASSIRTAVEANRWSWQRYLINRWSRLSVVLFPALLVTLMWDSAPELLGVSAAAPNSDTAVAIIDRRTTDARSSWSVMVGNFLYLQTILVPPFGSNTALWSLANEFWYYLIFPCIALALAKNVASGLVSRTVLFITGVSMLLMVRSDIASYMIVWLLGALAGAMPKWPPICTTRMFLAYMIISSTILLTVLAAIGFGKLSPGYTTDISLGLVFAAWLYGVLQDPTQNQFLAYRRAASFLAGFSYSLYATHLPLLVFLRECFTAEEPWQPTLFGWSLVLLSAIGAIVFAYYFSLVTERKTDALKYQVTRLLQKSAP